MNARIVQFPFILAQKLRFLYKKRHHLLLSNFNLHFPKKIMHN